MHVVSVCHRRDLWIWRYSQHLIATNLPASRFTLIVDDEDWPLFSYFTTSPHWEISKASAVLQEDFRHSLKLNLRKISKNLNFGWYWQQFLKIQFISQQTCSICLIWDADTVPLRMLSMPSDCLGFYCKSSEYHRPYWHLNSSLLGLDYGIYPEFSFVSQLMGISPRIVLDMIEMISVRNHSMNWLDAVVVALSNVPSNHRFSEYELMGSYAYRTTSPEAFINLEFPWIRNGSSFVDSLLRPSFHHIDSSLYAYAAFERRDIPKWTRSKDLTLKAISKIMSVVIRGMESCN